MGTLILLNDVSTAGDDAKLLVGDTDPAASMEGQDQADLISSYFIDHCTHIDLVYCSDALRLRKLVHNIRVHSKDSRISSLMPRRLEGLRERSFGVLNRSPLSLESDIFSHTRIKSEKGESVFECRARIMKWISSILEKNPSKKIVIVSHPFACQIAFNAMLQKDHTLLTRFWQEKGSFVFLDFEVSLYGVKWGFTGGYNALADRTYTQDEIYSQLLGKTRTFSS